MAIDMVKIRARVTIGRLVVETPYIQSFSVNLARGQISTFSAQLKVPYEDVISNVVGDAIVIEAGENSPSSIIFSGIIKRVKISPVFDDPAFVMLNMDGQDILSYLTNKKYTRRCRATTATWVTIDNVTRKGLRTGKFRARKTDATTVVPTDHLSDPNYTTTPGLALWQSEARGSNLIKKVIDIAQRVRILSDEE